VNIGTDHENTSFFEYLGVSLKNGGSVYDVNTLKGSCADCGELLKYNYLGGVAPHFMVDQLQPDGASLLLKSEDGYGRMYVYENDDYKVITSSVIIGAIANSDSLSLKPYLLSEFVNYFLGYEPVTSITDNSSGPEEFNAYPNPFSEGTTIGFKLAEPSCVTVSIHDLSGNRIALLADGIFQRGEHYLNWNTGHTTASLKKGFYLCTIQTARGTSSLKLIVLPQGNY